MLGNIRLLLSGNWNKELNIENKDTFISTLIAKIKPVPKNSEFMFGFSAFTINLNHLTKEQLAKIAPTDSRLRPDKRAYEHGDVDLAVCEKKRLEELQKAREKRRNKMKLVYKPRWFELSMDEDIGENFYKYKGGYWERRDNRNWTKEGETELIDLYNG